MSLARVPLLVLALLGVAGCTAANVEKAAGSFHDGYADSIKTLSNRTTALVSSERTKNTYTLYQKQNAASGDTALVKAFAEYVCLPIPRGLQTVNSGLATLGTASSVVDPANVTPDKNLPDKVKGIFAAADDFPPLKPADSPQASGAEYCKSVILAYMALAPSDLPSLDGNQRAPVFAILAIPALISLVEGIWKAADSTLGLLEEEARANKLKRYIKDTDTQNTVSASFAQIYTNDQAANKFCNDTSHAVLCGPSVSMPPDTKKPKDAGTATDTSIADSQTTQPACFAEIDQTLFSVPKYRTIMDSVTIVERWSNLRLAWYNFYALERGSADVDKVQRRQALDQSINDYLAVPATPDIARSMVQAWAQLTYMSNDCITGSEAFGELKVFAENAYSVFNSAKSVSDARDKFDSAIAPAKTAK